MESSFSFPTTALLGIFAFATIIYFFRLLLIRTKYDKSVDGHKKPPCQKLAEAGGAWRLIGHLHLLGGPVPPHIILASMADKCGPIFTIKTGVHRALIVSNWQIAKQCLTMNDVENATYKCLEESSRKKLSNKSQLEQSKQRISVKK